MSTKTVRPLVLVLGAACLLVGACASKSDTSTGLSGADDTQAIGSTTQTSRFDEMLYSPITSKDPTEAASSVAAAQWWPAGCATRALDASDPKVVHVTLNDCTGPFGLRHHSGEITVVFSQNPDGSLHSEATSSDMTVNGKAATYARSADITSDGTSRTIVSHGAWTRVADDGDTVSHTSSHTTTVDTVGLCRSTSGTGVTNIGDREIDSSITDYKVCHGPAGVDGCPSGTITHVRKSSGDTVTIAFDGSDEADLTGPKGNSIEVPLVCIPLARVSRLLPINLCLHSRKDDYANISAFVGRLSPRAKAPNAQSRWVSARW